MDSWNPKSNEKHPTRNEELESIENVDLYVPTAVENMREIDLLEAGEMVKRLRMMTVREEDFGEDWYEHRLQTLGFEWCRLNDCVPAEAEDVLNSLKELEQRSEEGFAALVSGEVSQEFITGEHDKTEAYKQELLEAELMFLQMRGVDVGSYENLEAYIDTLVEVSGDVETWVSMYDDVDQLKAESYAKRMYLWAITGHYRDLFAAVQNTSKPLDSWELVAEGGIDKLSSLFSSFYANNQGGFDFGGLVGDPDSSPIIRPNWDQFTDTLITHTTGMESALSILRTGQIDSLRSHYGVCFSSGLVSSTMRREDEVALVFPREVVQKAYLAESYSELTDAHEQEVRTFQDVSMSLCLGILRVSDIEDADTTFGFGSASKAWGKKDLDKLGEEYLKTGKLESLR